MTRQRKCENCDLTIFRVEASEFGGNEYVTVKTVDADAFEAGQNVPWLAADDDDMDTLAAEIKASMLAAKTDRQCKPYRAGHTY